MAPPRRCERRRGFQGLALFPHCGGGTATPMGAAGHVLVSRRCGGCSCGCGGGGGGSRQRAAAAAACVGSCAGLVALGWQVWWPVSAGAVLIWWRWRRCRAREWQQERRQATAASASTAMPQRLAHCAAAAATVAVALEARLQRAADCDMDRHQQRFLVYMFDAARQQVAQGARALG
jgi:hypothetical protein